MLKYNFLSFGRWVPFWDAGAGMLWTNLAPRLPEQSTPFNFVLETGPGVHYVLTASATLTLGVRYHHISNADIGHRNTGLNAALPTSACPGSCRDEPRDGTDRSGRLAHRLRLALAVHVRSAR